MPSKNTASQHRARTGRTVRNVCGGVRAVGFMVVLGEGEERVNRRGVFVW
ncbi:hypothetical protein ABZX85_36880 [Streptomyces sp. NPDC004539]